MAHLMSVISPILTRMTYTGDNMEDAEVNKEHVIRVRDTLIKATRTLDGQVTVMEVTQGAINYILSVISGQYDGIPMPFKNAFATEAAHGIIKILLTLGNSLDGMRDDLKKQG